MHCGVKFCGGCNSRYDRGAAFSKIQDQLLGQADFTIAQEDVEYDLLLLIGGCTNCCASYDQFTTKEGILKIWDESHIENIVRAIKNLDMKVESGGLINELETNL